MKIKNLQGECQQCGEPIEFRAETIGMTADCPHCGQPTELRLSVPPEAKSSAQTKAIIFTIIAVMILGGGFIGVLVALKRADLLSARQQANLAKINNPSSPVPEGPFVPDGFGVSPVAFDRNPGGAMVYAVGKVLNLTDRQRFGVRVELELLDASGSKIGKARDYQAVLAPNAEWQFRALVVPKDAMVAKIIAITETQ